MQKLKKFSILFYIIYCFFFSCSIYKEIPPVINKGILDLKNWDFSKQGMVPLKGEWEFYYNQLLNPEDFINNSYSTIKYLNSPSSWTDINLPEKGYATYRIKIINLKTNQMLGLKIPYMNSSYNLYLNGQLIAKNGIVATKEDLYIPQHLPQIRIFQNNSAELEIILQIANFSDNIGGIWESILIGTEEQIVKNFWISIGRELFFFGIILIMGLYHLFLYFFRNQEKASLYFSLFCIFMAIRISITGEKFLLQFFPFFPWGLHIKLEYLSIYFGLPVFSYFLFFAFNHKSKSLYLSDKRNFKYIITEEFYYPLIEFIFYFSIPFILITIFTNTIFYGDFLKLYQIFLLICAVYLFYGMVLATIKKKEGAIFSFIGIIIPFFTVINDILYAKRIIHTGYFLSFGMFVFILFQSLSLAYKFSRSFSQIEQLTNHLKQLLSTFEKFIPKEFLELLNKKDITKIQLGDQSEKEMTVMFSDIRKFTSISEHLTPEENFNFINLYLSFIEPVIRNHNGFIDKYLGDGFMALFSQSPEDALKASIKIQKTLSDFNQFIEEKNIEPIKTGIGIHAGKLMLGVVGSEHRIETTVISDIVNTASRLEKLNKDFGTDILITNAVVDHLKEKQNYKLRYIGTILLRGKTSPIKIYEVYNHYHDFIIENYDKTKEDFYKGISYFTNNKIDKALEIFENIIQINPYDNPARYYHFKCKSIIGF
ncbi:MAG: hypothetical protein KatS3mg129_1409 [Leptospiraceae bacterium]|nr:MAG: hypothetical protein KatS3mg129_1409 [Leptospiraceae bacterium]